MQNAKRGLLQNLGQLFDGGSQSLAARIVGISEGTRTIDGEKTIDYDQHIDPGNNVRNIGSFSYQAHQGGANTGEDADKLWNAKLRQQIPKYQQAMQSAKLDPNDPRLLFNFLDLYTQAPVAAVGKGGFLDQIAVIAKIAAVTKISLLQIVQARVDSYYDPDTKKLDAPGFGNDVTKLRADQKRRAIAVQTGIDHYKISL
jgi:hypothetical protein